MRKPDLILSLLCCLFAATYAHAENKGIEIQEYLDYLHDQFTESKLGNSKQGALIHQGRTHVELNVVVRKNEAGEIVSYVVEESENINPAAVHRLSFDISLVSSVEEAASCSQDAPSSTAEEPVSTATTAAQKPAKSPWYKHFFTW